MRRDVGRDLQLASCRAPLVSGTQVAQLRLHPVDRVAPTRPVPVLPSRGRLLREVRGVPVTSPLERARLRQPVLGELADRLEQAVSGTGGRVVGDDERLSDQRVEMPEDVHVVGSVDHGADARQVEAAGEDRRQAEQVALVVGQEVVGPLHGMAERELAFRPRRRPLQQPESIGESIPHLDRAHGRHPRGGQLDPQRESVEGLADLGHRGGGLRLAEPEVGPDGSGPVDEQRDGIGGHAPLQRERCHGEHRLAVHPEGLARRGEDPRRSRTDRGSPRRPIRAAARTCSQLSTTSRSRRAAERVGDRVDECRRRPGA